MRGSSALDCAPEEPYLCRIVAGAPIRENDHPARAVRVPVRAVKIPVRAGRCPAC